MTTVTIPGPLPETIEACEARMTELYAEMRANFAPSRSDFADTDAYLAALTETTTALHRAHAEWSRVHGHMLRITERAEAAGFGLVVGDRVQRKADRAWKIVGTIERIIPDQRAPRARVLWHGNVRYISGTTDQRSTIRLAALRKVA